MRGALRGGTLDEQTNGQHDADEQEQTTGDRAGQARILMP